MNGPRRAQVVPPWALAFGLAVAGALHTLAFEPVGAWWLQPLSAAALAAAVARASPRRAFALAFVFALGWLGSGWWWLHVSLHRYGGLPGLPAAAAVALLAAAMSLYLAAAMALAARWRTGSAGIDAALFAAAWLAAELARGTWFTGFPWSASGYAHTDGPLSALAPWLGVYGIGAVAAWAGAIVALAPRDASPAHRASLAGATAVAALVAAAHLAPSEFTRPAGTLSASLLQPNVAQDLKFDPARMNRNLARLIELLHEAPGPLVVTPESVVPLPRDAIDADTWAAMRTPFLDGRRGALVGLFLADEKGYVNSMVGLSREASPTPLTQYAYGKRHLLPFGEFVPPGFGWFVQALDIPLGDQARGRHAKPFDFGGQRLRPLICYEDLFAEQLVESIVGPDAATVFVNASNLAWFGRHLVQDQHLQFSRMRALEFQRPFLRATNTGATTAIDHRGQVTGRLPPLVEGRLDVTVQGRTGETPYARWLHAAGHAPLWALVVGVALLANRMRHRRANAGPGR
jgi:apolipoprotein N-acyltransferase